MGEPKVGDEVLVTLDNWVTARMDSVREAREDSGPWVITTADGKSYTSLRNPTVGPQQWCWLEGRGEA